MTATPTALPASAETRFPLAQAPFDEKVQQIFDKVDFGDLAPQNYLRVLAHHPRILGNVVALGGTLMYKTQLDERLRELAIFRTAARTQSTYEWAMHRALFGDKCGITAEEREALRTGPADAPCWNERERLVIAATDELHDRSNVSDATWSQMRKLWPQDQLLEIVVVIGFYHLVAYFMNVSGAAPEAGAVHLAEAWS